MLGVSAQESGWLTTYNTFGHDAILLMEDGHTVRGRCLSHFLTKEITDFTMDGAHVWHGDGLLWQANHTGFSAFGTMEFRLGYGRRFGQHLAVMLRGCYLWRHARHYEGTHSFTIDLSIAYQMNRKLLFAISLYNPIRMKYGITGNEVIPMTFDFRMCYRAGKQVWMDIILHKRLPSGFEAGGGVFYKPNKTLSFQLTGSNLRCSLGVMVGWGSWRLQLFSDWYYRTGITPGIDLWYHQTAHSL